ncbi:MAG: hypothetical protein RLY31_2158 [Bacteroidota bacterium]|jgi:uncharacterized protein (DUF58 family)
MKTDTTELFRKVRKIEIKSRGLSRQLLSGEYHSAFKGRGMSFSEVRNYQFGDDVRNIDWNVTARTGTPFVKVFEEERELTVLLVIDMSRSTFFGTVHQYKQSLMTEMSAVLAFSAIRNNDKVGILLFTDEIERFIPPKKGRTHILHIIRELVDFQPKGTGTDIGKALDYVNKRIKKRCICFLLSDFIAPRFESGLRITSRRHDLVGIHLSDPREETLPSVGLLLTRDAEEGTLQWLDTDDPRQREQYAAAFADNHAYCKRLFARHGVDLLNIRTDRPYVKALSNFFRTRRH